MRIMRDNQLYELTPMELEQAYCEQRRQYHTEDATRQLLTVAGYDEYDAPEEDDALVIAFERQYGVSLIALFHSKRFIEACVNDYESNTDCNLTENDLWRATIDIMIQKAERCPSII